MMSENAYRVAMLIFCCQKRKGHPMHLLRQEPSLTRLVLNNLGVLSTKNLDRFSAGVGVRDVQFHPRTGRLYVLTRKKLLAFNTFRPEWPQMLSVPSPFPLGRTLSRLAVHETRPLAVVSDLFGSFTLLDTKGTFRNLQTLRLDRRCYDGSIGGIHFHRTRALLAVGTKQRVLFFRGKGARFELLRRTSFACAGYVHTVRLHPTGPLCFFADHQGGVHVANLDTNVVRFLPFICSSPCALATLGNGFGLAAVSCFSGVQVCSINYNGADLCIRREMSLEAALGSCPSGTVAVHPRLPLLAYVCKTHATVRVCRTDTGARISKIHLTGPDNTPSRIFGFGPCASVLLDFHPRLPLLVVVVAGKRFILSKIF